MSHVSLFLENANQTGKVADHDHVLPVIEHYFANKLAKQIVSKIKVSFLLKKLPTKTLKIVDQVY